MFTQYLEDSLVRRTSLGNHFYGKDGSPQYYVVGANGKTRDSTLADARKNGWVPSVTTIMSEAAAPGLDTYRQNQLLDACISLPPDRNDLMSWRRKIADMSKQHAKKASERGNEIHDGLDNYFKTGEALKDKEFILPVIEFLNDYFPNVVWVSEASFASSMGFGGKVDLHSKTHNIVLDFKTKDQDEFYFDKLKAYDTHHMQTAAYTVGLKLPTTSKRYNLFISTQKPGLMKLTESKDFEREWGLFECLLNYWKLKNNYKH